MTTKNKPELMIASWPDRPVDTCYFTQAAIAAKRIADAIDNQLATQRQRRSA